MLAVVAEVARQFPSHYQLFQKCAGLFHATQNMQSHTLSRDLIEVQIGRKARPAVFIWIIPFLFVACQLMIQKVA